MIGIRAALRRARHFRDSDDTGFSLIETLVAMSIFAVFMGLVMAAILSMLTSTQKTQSLDDGAAQLENAFQKLDHQVRYANGIDPEGQVGSNWFVEFQVQSTATSPQTCYQLKYNVATSQLLERSWQPAVSPVVATSWLQLARNIVNDPVAQPPFHQLPTDTAHGIGHQQLQVNLWSRPNGQTTKTSTKSQSQASFTGLNTNANTGLVCKEVARS